MTTKKFDFCRCQVTFPDWYQTQRSMTQQGKHLVSSFRKVRGYLNQIKCIIQHIHPPLMWRAWADDKTNISTFCKKFQHFGIWLLYLESLRKMHSKEFKHAWYWFINSWNSRWNFRNVRKQTYFFAPLNQAQRSKRYAPTVKALYFARYLIPQISRGKICGNK